MDRNAVLDSLGCKLIRVGWVVHFWLLKNTNFVWFDALTMIVNNQINIFILNPSTIFY